MQPTEDVTTALADQLTELADLLAPLTEADWARPSPCEGWSVADVVLHLAQTNELAIDSVRGRFAETAGSFATAEGATGSVDDGAALMVAKERGEPGRVVRARWQASADEMLQALSACDPHARLTWVSGELAARTLTSTRLAETWIHTGDVADGLDRPLPPSDRLWHVARLAWRTLPYAFARAGRQLTGSVAFDLSLPSGQPCVFMPENGEPTTTIRGPVEELCLVAGRRRDPAETSLAGVGPDAAAVLDLVRTYA